MIRPQGPRNQELRTASVPRDLVPCLPAPVEWRIEPIRPAMPARPGASVERPDAPARRCPSTRPPPEGAGRPAGRDAGGPRAVPEPPGRGHPGRPAVRVRPAVGLPPAVLLLRHAA